MTATHGTPDTGAKIAAQSVALRDVLAAKQTVSVVGWCVVYIQLRASDDDNLGVLHSPCRQIAFLLGLLLSTPELNNGDQDEESEWERILGALNDVCQHVQRVLPAGGAGGTR